MMKTDILKQVSGDSVADFRFHIMCVNVWMEMDSTKDIVPCKYSCHQCHYALNM